LPRHSLPEQLRLDQRVTFPVHSAANRQVAVTGCPRHLRTWLSWRAGRLLCRSTGLRWCTCRWRCVRRWRRRLLPRPLRRRLRKRSQRYQAETESKQCFHNFGGVELTARHIPFIPKQLDTSRDKSFHLSSATVRLGERHLYFASGTVRGCKPQRFNNHRALTTRFRSGGQLSIRASNSSPSRIGPTPDGVPVKITSPGTNVSDWLVKETI
jgi:hypothetical protein